MDIDEDRYSALTEATSTIKKDEDKPPHDASIFVGSLPSNIDQGDLTRMLMEHLSEHTQIKNVKVVRDSKGGVCAFVQCLDASSATTLIDTLYSSPPKPFLGRILRYEPARAFRTLIISYRTPTQLVKPVAYTSGPCKDQEIELELPTAMRIWKHRNSRFHGIQYNGDAIQAEERADTGNSDESVLIHPMKYDDETLQKIAMFFGPLESFGVPEIDGDSQSPSVYPVPHNGSRSSVMDPKCWEVKWQHRDDCVSALMTLRRVPHLTVTWAHQSFQPQFRYVPGIPYSQTFPHCVQGPYLPPSGARPLSHTNGFTPIGHATNQNIRPQHSHYSQFGRKATHPSKLVACGRTPGRSPHSTVPTSSIQTKPLVSAVFPPSGDDKFVGRPENQDVELSSSPNAGVQELYIPHTSELHSTSITPGSQFPITPTTSGTSYDGFGSNDDGKLPGIQKEIDPTTLFVGGLEASGPGAWDEVKVRQLFARFGGLECVKFVRPANSTAAFAFVKFNNVEAPARAVCEEHNRVYEGRTLRVQLRELNPPKNTWKFGRGHGKVPHRQSEFQRQFNHQPCADEKGYVTASLHQKGTNISGDDGGRLEPSNSIPLPHGYDPSQGSSTLGLAEMLSPTPAMNHDASGTERYREWYDGLESPSHTPASSSLGSSASATGVSCTVPSYYMPNGPYFPPPWMLPCVPQGPYPMPYYSGYALFQPPQQPPGSDVSGSAVGSHPVWPTMSVYGSFVPYPMFPQPPVVEQAMQTHAVGQPPLTPSGFIQNEQGTLIAVYQPEALSQYMGSGNVPITVHPQDGIGPKYVGYDHRHYNQETLQPSVIQHVPAGQGQPIPGFTGGPLHRIPDARRSPMPFRDSGPNVNASFNPILRRSHSHYSRNNQNTNITRVFSGKAGRDYLHNTGSDYGRRGGQTGRMFSDWNR